MTSREARRARRESERKAAKLARKAAQNQPQNGFVPQNAPVPDSPDEFSPEFIAHARSVRDRIAQNASLPRHSGHRSAESTSSSSQNGVRAESSRAEINRANAAHSTGPRTPTGKLASSRNSLKHGLASGQLIISGEDPTAFNALRDALLEEHQPANTTESMLIHEMAQSYWLMHRALRLQNDCFRAGGVDEKRLSLFLRYHTTHERAFHKSLNLLIRLQKERRRAAATDRNGFVSQKPEAAVFDPGFVSQNHPAAPPSHLTAPPPELAAPSITLEISAPHAQ